MPNWIPAPAKTTPKEEIKSSSKSSKSSRRQSYPLCLVCEYDHDEVQNVLEIKKQGCKKWWGQLAGGSPLPPPPLTEYISTPLENKVLIDGPYDRQTLMD